MVSAQAIQIRQSIWKFVNRTRRKQWGGSIINKFIMLPPPNNSIRHSHLLLHLPTRSGAYTTSTDLNNRKNNASSACGKTESSKFGVELYRPLSTGRRQRLLPSQTLFYQRHTGRDVSGRSTALMIAVVGGRRAGSNSWRAMVPEGETLAHQNRLARHQVNYLLICLLTYPCGYGPLRRMRNRQVLWTPVPRLLMCVQVGGCLGTGNFYQEWWTTLAHSKLEIFKMNRIIPQRHVHSLLHFVVSAFCVFVGERAEKLWRQFLAAPSLTSNYQALIESKCWYTICVHLHRFEHEQHCAQRFKQAGRNAVSRVSATQQKESCALCRCPGGGEKSKPQ